MISPRPFLVATVVICAGLACGSSTDYSTSGGGGNPPTGDILIVSGAATKANQAFNPNPFTVALNGGASVSVKWANQDNGPHTVTQDGASPTFDHDTPAGGTFTFVFTTAGTYTYHCTRHPSMVASVTVDP